MKGTVPRLPLKQEVVDTVLICFAFLITSMVLEGVIFRVLVGFCFIMAILEIIITSVRSNAVCTSDHEAIACSLACLMLAVALVLIFMFRLDGAQYLLWIGVVTASDAFGLFFGRIFGTKRPFFSKRISPNKTYAGYLGELLGSVCTGFIILWVFKMPLSAAHVAYVCSGFIFSAIGDLIGSAAKRELKIKDSSDKINSLPVFGKVELLMRSRHGYLDCFDSASLALIFFVLLIKWCP